MKRNASTIAGNSMRYAVAVDLTRNLSLCFFAFTKSHTTNAANAATNTARIIIVVVSIFYPSNTVISVCF